MSTGRRSPVKAQPDEFAQTYTASKQHAARFGWSVTNADIRFVANTHHTPALGDLSPAQRAELRAKWALDMGESHVAPPVDYELVREALQRHHRRFGREATTAVIQRIGRCPWATNIKHSLRQALIDALNEAVDADIERARRVAGKPPRKTVVSVTTPATDQPYVTFDTLVPRKNDLQEIQKQMELIEPASPDLKSALRRRGPITAEISQASTQSLEDVTLCFGTPVTLKDGTRGRVTSLRTHKDNPSVCDRLVVLTDDLRTVVLEHGDAIAFHVVEAGRRATDNPYARV